MSPTQNPVSCIWRYDGVLFYKKKLMNRESFSFYQSFRNATKTLPKDNQKNALVMIVEYGIDWIEPNPEIDGIAYAIFLMAKPQIDRNNKRFVNGTEWWRPKKDWDNSQKPKDNQTITKPEANTNTNTNIKNNIILLNNTEIEISEHKKELSLKISSLIKELRITASQYKIAYNNKNERNFWNHIINAKEYWAFCDSIWQDRVEFAKNVMIESFKNNYRRWVCAWPMSIYQNYADVYNKHIQQSVKSQVPTF